MCFKAPLEKPKINLETISFKFYPEQKFMSAKADNEMLPQKKLINKGSVELLQTNKSVALAFF